MLLVNSLVKILPIKMALCSVIMVGLSICGYNHNENFVHEMSCAAVTIAFREIYAYIITEKYCRISVLIFVH